MRYSIEAVDSRRHPTPTAARPSRQPPLGTVRPLARCVCMRIAEHHVVRDNPVVAIEEGTMVRVEGTRGTPGPAGLAGQ